MAWRQVRAKLHARAGRYADAERLALEALDLGEQPDLLNWYWQAWALVDLSEVYVLAGRPEEGCTRLEQALGLYERKGNLASAANTRSALHEAREAGGLVTERTMQ
jgi:tetratricopeptide (TPR) repeat protein